MRFNIYNDFMSFESFQRNDWGYFGQFKIVTVLIS